MSSLCRQFAGKSLLVTGSTGFLAKAFVAKALRDLPDLRRLVLLIRPRARPGGEPVGATERFEREILGSSVFRSLRAELGEAFDDVLREKVVAVDGDLTLDGLGLDDEGLTALEEVDALVNSAATVVFDERVDEAVSLNTQGVQRLLGLARRLGDVPLLHVSTAYVCGQVQGLVPEEPPSLDRVVADDLEGRPEGTLDLDAEVEELLAAARAVLQDEALVARAANDEERRRIVKDRLVEIGMARARARGWNDTYTYTKSLGERLLVRDHGAVPACIVRPAIIESSLSDPEPGWIDGLRMADPLFAAYGKGLLRSFPSEPDALIDFVPVDHVVNAMLAALAALLAEREAGTAPEGVPVYHVATSSANPLRFQHLSDLTREYFERNPLPDRKGRPTRARSWRHVPETRFVRAIRSRLTAVRAARGGLRPLPARLAKKPRARLSRLAAQMERILYYAKIYRPYCCFPARFDTRRTEALHAGLSEEDRARFDFDPRGFDWSTYLQDIHLPGLIRNVLREDAPEPMAHSAAEVVPSHDALGRTLIDLVTASAERWPDRVALQGRSDGGWPRITHAELLRAALGAARRLREAGVEVGDRVLLLSENRPEWPMTYFGIVAAGATAVPLDAQTPAARLAAVAELTAARAAVVSPGLRGALPSAFAPRVFDAADLAAARLDPSEAAEHDLPAALSPEAPASLLFTSGTTLEPKGVVLPHRAFMANVEGIIRVLGPTDDDRLVSVLPLHHAFEFTAGMLAPLAVGASITYLETVSSESIVGTLKETRATVLLGVPRLYELILEGIRRQLGELRGGAGAAIGALRGTSRAFSAMGVRAGRALLAPLHARFGGCLRHLVSGGAALDPAVHRELSELGFTVVEGYGLTETAPVVTVNPPDHTRAGSVGRPLPGLDVRINRPAADGVGEIIVRGPSVMAGYYKDPDATGRALRQGWFHTGDLGRFDADGYLHVTGRLKDLIVTAAGKNVYPDEVEAQLKDVPGVRELCVVGVQPRPGGGEEVHLVAVLEGEASDDAREAVRASVGRRLSDLASHQRVQRIHFWMEELPKTALLKVKRGAVRAQLEGESVRAAAGGADVLEGTDALARELLDLLARLTKAPRASLRRDQDLAFDLGVDSLMRVELVACIEGATGTDVADDTAQGLATVGDVLDMAAAVGRRRRASPRGPRSRAGADGTAPRPAGRERSSLLSRTAAPLVRATWPLLYGRYLRLDVRGREHLPGSGPYVIAANHQSHLDAGAVVTALGAESRRLHVVAARDYFFDTPFKSAFFSELLNAIPFDRQGDFSAGLAACRAALEAGDPLLIFPEGTRSPDGRLQEFKAGLGILALELDVPIVPAFIEGTHAALPKGARLLRRSVVRVSFGPALTPHTLARSDGELPYERYRSVVDAVRREIVGLSGVHSGASAPAP